MSTDTQETALPLQNVKVLDMASVLAAPVAATFLGDFGCEVVKVEDPGSGDLIRGAAPGARSPYWAQEARNKRSITLNLRTPAGRDILRSLIPHFDVVLTNLRPPTLEKWGFMPEQLQPLNPRAIFVYLTGYGLTGPYRDRGSFDRIASSFAGLTYATGYPDRPPVRAGFSIADYIGSYLAAFAAVTALYERDAGGSGLGQVVDLALYEGVFRATEDALVTYATQGRIHERQGNLNRKMIPADDYETADGRSLTVHAGSDPLFRRLAEVMGRPDLANQDSFGARSARIADPAPVYAAVADWVGSHTADDAAKILNDAGIPATPLMNIADIANDPHYLQRGTFEFFDDPEFGRLPMAAPLPRLSRTPGQIRTAGPALGDASDEVYSTLLGFSDGDLTRLRDEGVI